MLHFTLVSKKIQCQAEQLPNLEIWGAAQTPVGAKCCLIDSVNSSRPVRGPARTGHHLLGATFLLASRGVSTTRPPTEAAENQTKIKQKLRVTPKGPPNHTCGFMLEVCC